MAKDVREYRCLLISPSDVEAERDAVTQLVTAWNAQIGNALRVRIELVKSESHATPDASKPPQDVINERLLDDCDLGIAVFWARMGTPTRKRQRGSLEEVYRLLERRVRVLVYFNNSPIPQDRLKGLDWQTRPQKQQRS